jgi:hypothetical protein
VNTTPIENSKTLGRYVVAKAKTPVRVRFERSPEKDTPNRIRRPPLKSHASAGILDSLRGRPGHTPARPARRPQILSTQVQPTFSNLIL